MRKVLKNIGYFFLATRVDALGKPHPNWGETILAYLVILAIILVAVYFVELGLETTGWYGSQQMP